MRIIQRYLRKAIISAILVVSLTLLGIESFMEFINELSDIGKQDYGIVQASYYVLMQLPSDFYQLFPIAGFLGSLIGLGRLANHSELIVMRASGISVIRITWIVAKTALMLLLVLAVVGEWWAPQLQYHATIMKQLALHKTLEADMQELWIRHDNSFLHIEHVLTPTQIDDIISYDFDKNNKLLQATSAQDATYANGHWLLHNVHVSSFQPNQIISRQLKQSLLSFNFNPTLLRELNRDTTQETLIGLWHNIQSHRQAGLVATRFELDFWQRVLQPLTILVMICLGVPFIFGSLRQASTSGRILIGITIGFGFYMANRFIGPLTLVYQWPPWLVAALPTMVFTLLGIYLLYRTKSR